MNVSRSVSSFDTICRVWTNLAAGHVAPFRHGGSESSLERAIEAGRSLRERVQGSLQTFRWPLWALIASTSAVTSRPWPRPQ